MSKEAMKLALGKIKSARDCHPNAVNTLLFEAEEILEEALEKPDFWEGYVPEPVKPATEESSATQAQQALDKKAENARELGLDYEPAQQEFVSPGGGYVPAIPVQQRPIKTFHGGKAWPVQEPAQPVQDNPLDCGVHLGSGKDHAIKHHVSYGPAQPVPDAFEQLMREADKPTQVPEEIAKCVNALMDGMHEITSVTIRPKRTWVGLSDEELSEVYNQADWDTVNGWEYERAIEAKLRSKNEDRN